MNVLPDTVKEYFDQIANSFSSANAAGMTATYQFDITGEGGGKWFAKIENGALASGEGETENPSCTVTVSASDWLDILSGKLDGQMAFMAGKLKIAGDMSLAMKLKSLFMA
ncbi:MAG: SCP2 sterol-binding domain-containing protein [Candidatus Hydrogenedentes bacterium]|nr:SCP2 sterol-binding domain-containing protein [Candidatus Hydrogenedentota bacterium]